MEIVASPRESVRATLAPWQRAMQTAIRDGAELCRRLQIPEKLASSNSAASFPVFVPLGFLAKMRPGDPADPLLRQVLPLADEELPVHGYSNDPVGDLAAQSEPGILQKYHGRILLITTGVCAIHCRYCFRRHFPYQDGPRQRDLRQAAVQLIAADRSIEEVILSGGDPLTLPDPQLRELVDSLAEIPHLKRLRVHSRLPIVIPERVTPELVDILKGSRLTPIMVVHANHPRELDEEAGDSIARLVDHGIPVLNQAVLLRGVNDDVETLAGLSRRLIELRVMPYYLHQLDRVAGAAHFEVPEAKGLEWMEQLRGLLPGYAIPRYVREQPGDIGKSWVD